MNNELTKSQRKKGSKYNQNDKITEVHLAKASGWRESIAEQVETKT